MAGYVAHTNDLTAHTDKKGTGMRIITRREWGARYADGFGALRPPATEVWLHHTGGTEPDNAVGIRHLEQVGQDRFAGGISYTFLIGQSGTVYEGTTPNREGAHTLGHNTVGRAICWIGNYEIIRPTEQIIQATADLLVFGRDQGWWTQATLTGGHRDLYATKCPGNHAYVVIGEVNRRAGGASQDDGDPNMIPTMQYGERSDNVQRLQQFMTSRFESYNQYYPTGYYGNMTRDGIAEFQRRTGITGPDANGEIVGPRTKVQLWRRGFRG